MHCEDEPDCLTEIIVDTSAKPNSLYNRPEIVVEQDDGGCLAGYIGAAPPHGDPNVRRLQRRGIVDAIAGHGDDLALRFQTVHDPKFLLRHDPGEHIAAPEPVSERSIAELLHLIAGQHDFGFETCLTCYGACRCRVIASNHNDSDSSGNTFGDRSLHTWPNGVSEAHQSEELKIKVAL